MPTDTAPFTTIATARSPRTAASTREPRPVDAETVTVTRRRDARSVADERRERVTSAPVMGRRSR